MGRVSWGSVAIMGQLLPLKPSPHPTIPLGQVSTPVSQVDATGPQDLKVQEFDLCLVSPAQGLMGGL